MRFGSWCVLYEACESEFNSEWRQRRGDPPAATGAGPEAWPTRLPGCGRSPAESEIAIGGAGLAAAAAALDLIDEYRSIGNLVLHGGGMSNSPDDQRCADLELVGSRIFRSRVVHARYRVVR
jgi:hypothetical protein